MLPANLILKIKRFPETWNLTPETCPKIFLNPGS